MRSFNDQVNLQSLASIGFGYPAVFAFFALILAESFSHNPVWWVVGGLALYGALVIKLVLKDQRHC